MSLQAFERDAAQPSPRPALRFPLDGYSPDPPSTPPTVLEQPETAGHLAGLAAGYIDRLGDLAEDLERQLAAARNRRWGDLLGELLATAPDGIDLAMIVTPGPTTPGEGQIREELGHAARHLGVPALELKAQHNPVTERVTLELRRP